MIHSGEGLDAPLFCGHGVPGVVAGIEYIIIGLENAMAEEIILEELPWFFGGVAFRRVGGDADERDVFRHFQSIAAMPSGTIDNECCMHIDWKLQADFIQMQLHHFRIHPRQHQPHRRIALRAERPEDIGVFIARIDGHGRPAAFDRPAMRAPSFLPNARFILTPKLNALFGMFLRQVLQFFAEFF